MFTEEGNTIPSNLTLKIHDTKPPCKLFLAVFQKINKN